MWGRGARELYYPGPDYYMMVVDIPDKADLKPSVARKVFPIGPVLFWGSGGRAYDVDPEGQLFYATIPKLGSSVPGITGINIIQNWFEELKRLCPTGKK
jgi:hypothetical protein